jgi:hypothetical protein
MAVGDGRGMGWARYPIPVRIHNIIHSYLSYYERVKRAMKRVEWPVADGKIPHT